MKTKLLLAPAAVALVVMWAAGPALAQSGNNERRSRDRSARASQSANQDREARDDRARADVAVRRTESRAEASRGDRNAQRDRSSDTRGSEARQYAERRQASPRADQSRAGGAQYDNRGSDNRAYANRGYDSGRYGNQAYANRGYDSGRYGNQAYANRGYDNGRYGNRAYGWNGSYDRNSWRSRLRFGLGLSIFAGRPFAFRFDYGWRPSFSYRYSMRPGMAYGGMSFLLDPDYAEVYIDGEFVGIARDFGGQPVPVAVGVHRIELYAQGFEPAAFDINVFPGQVIPYRGSLYPEY